MIGGGCPHEHMFAILHRCEPSTARSRAGAPSTASAGCRSPSRSIRTWAAPTAARSVTSAPSRRAPTGRGTTATAQHPGEDERRGGAAARARPPVLGARAGRDRGGDGPYQPAEGRYRLTRACIEALADAASPFAIITRGPLIVRDVDVLVEASRRADVSVTFSVPTLDEEIWRRTEPGTSPPRQRLRALSRLVDAGIDARVGMAPILPGLSDRPELLAEVVREARAAGATGIWATSSTCGRERASTSSPRSTATGRTAPGVRAAVPPRRLPPTPGNRAVRERVRALARSHGVRDRRRVRLEPAAQAEQLQIAAM